jgi:hypothetical protein
MSNEKDKLIIETLENLSDEIENIKLQKGDKGDKGEDGKDYILTEKDKKEIAKEIKVPIVEKVIEKTEIKNEVKEVAKYETSEQIADKLNELDEKVEAKVIKGLPKLKDFIDDIKKNKLIETKDIKGMPLNFNDMRWHGGGATNFLILDDTPDSYKGQTGKILSVKADETGLEFITGGSSIPEYTSDPVSPTAETAWVVKSGSGVIPDGTPIGLLLALTYTGNEGIFSYQLRYRTLEATTVNL